MPIPETVPELEIAETIRLRQSTEWSGHPIDPLWVLIVSGDLTLGEASLHDQGNGIASLGYKLEEQARGMGIATQVGSYLRDRAFQDWGFSTVRLGITVANEKSQAVAARLGATCQTVNGNWQTWLIHKDRYGE